MIFNCEELLFLIVLLFLRSFIFCVLINFILIPELFLPTAQCMNPRPVLQHKLTSGIQVLRLFLFF